MPYYLVNNKEDDYNNCRVEVVETSLQHAKEYYSHTALSGQDVLVLMKYFPHLTEEEEAERTADERFGGSGG